MYSVQWNMGTILTYLLLTVSLITHQPWQMQCAPVNKPSALVEIKYMTNYKQNMKLQEITGGGSMYISLNL